MGAQKKMRVLLLLAALATANAMVRTLRPQYYSDSTCTKLVGSGPMTNAMQCAPDPHGTYDGTKYTESAKPLVYRKWSILDSKTSTAVCGKPDSGEGVINQFWYSDSSCTKHTYLHRKSAQNMTADFYKCKATAACKVDGCNMANATQTRLLYTKLLCTSGVGALTPSMLLAAVT